MKGVGVKGCFGVKGCLGWRGVWGEGVFGVKGVGVKGRSIAAGRWRTVSESACLCFITRPMKSDMTRGRKMTVANDVRVCVGVCVGVCSLWFHMLASLHSSFIRCRLKTSAVPH